MRKEVDLMLFDFDGTLVDSGADLACAVNQALEKMNLPPKPAIQIIGYVGDGVRQLIARAVGEANAFMVDAALDHFTEYYRDHLLDKTKLYPHVKETLVHFSKKKKVILTNKRLYFTKTIAEGLGIATCFEDIVGADSTPYLKPDPRIVDYVLLRHGAARERTVIIGDGKNDVAVARNAGISCVALLNGLGAREDLLAMKPDFCCESLLELQTIFY